MRGFSLAVFVVVVATSCAGQRVRKNWDSLAVGTPARAAVEMVGAPQKQSTMPDGREALYWVLGGRDHVICRLILDADHRAAEKECTTAEQRQAKAQDGWRAIQAGWSRDQVLASMGHPHNSELINGRESYLWNMGGYTTCGVLFGRSGQVEGKRCETDHAARQRDDAAMMQYMMHSQQMQQQQNQQNQLLMRQLQQTFQQPAVRPATYTNCTTTGYGATAQTNCTTR